MTKEKTVDDLLHFMRQVENPYWMIDIVERMRWIPVEERLPDPDDCYCLVTTSDGEIDVRGYDYSKGWGWDGFERIIAWMPLPKPYRPEDE